MHFVDAFSSFTWIYKLRNKYEALQTFINFKNQVELQLDHKIKSIQIDWGGEYRDSLIFFILMVSFIESLAHTHEQNGVAKRKHRHIMENGLTLLAHASMPLKYWDEAF